MFNTLLIANRGEIAVRIIRACRDLGVRSALIVSEADQESLAARLADRRFVMAGLGARESYLSIPDLIHAAEALEADAVHPGYGFLAERAELAEACDTNYLGFVGPSAEAIRMLGDKKAARDLVRSLDGPLLPGTDVIENEDTARTEADRIGYPVLIKAVAGGGGRGMRLARTPEELKALLPSAQSEARSAFGNGAVYLEHYLASPRHIEIQFAADAHGHAVHLGERECSIQRRYQKLLEESPAPGLDPAVRAQMGDLAVRAALVAGYRGLGTCEFLMDEEGRFYFLEVNTRLQVEHPVTELVTGLDLVTLQIRLAAGEPLPFTQDQVVLRGAAMECRITCEDPANNFAPSPGKVGEIRWPLGPGVRVDSGLAPYSVIPSFYDSLAAKIIAYGADREEARRRMIRALEETVIMGVPTTIPFYLDLLRHPDFVKGAVSTHFLPEAFGAWAPEMSEDLVESAAVAAAIESVVRRGRGNGAEPASASAAAAWRQAGRMEGQAFERGERP